MSVHFKKITICALVVLSAFVFCSKEQNVEKVEKMMGVKSGDATIQKLEAFLNIPIYPGAKLASIITEKNDNQIPDERMDATVSLIVDAHEKVPPFYVEKLEKTFEVDKSGDKTYYTLKFDKEGWKYEIYIGQDTFMNQPTYDIQMMKIEE